MHGKSGDQQARIEETTHSTTHVQQHKKTKIKKIHNEWKMAAMANI